MDKQGDGWRLESQDNLCKSLPTSPVLWCCASVAACTQKERGGRQGGRPMHVTHSFFIQMWQCRVTRQDYSHGNHESRFWCIFCVFLSLSLTPFPNQGILDMCMDTTVTEQSCRNNPRHWRETLGLVFFCANPEMGSTLLMAQRKESL